MSWDAGLLDEGATEIFWVNYTHNTNPMIYAVLDDAGYDLGSYVLPNGIMSRNPWWAGLDGKPGPEGAAFLHLVIKGLQADPDRFQAMNPPNGWGNYDGLLETLIKMRNSVPERPTTWWAGG